jgi:hypothetical protein
MIRLYSYPELFSIADNNGYGLKVAFMRLAGVPFWHEHIFEQSIGQTTTKQQGTVSCF